jgi:hypothetical protein
MNPQNKTIGNHSITNQNTGARFLIVHSVYTVYNGLNQGVLRCLTMSTLSTVRARVIAQYIN